MPSFSIRKPPVVISVRVPGVILCESRTLERLPFPWLWKLKGKCNCPLFDRKVKKHLLFCWFWHPAFVAGEIEKLEFVLQPIERR